MVSALRHENGFIADGIWITSLYDLLRSFQGTLPIGLIATADNTWLVSRFE